MSIRRMSSRGLNQSSKVDLFMRLWDVPTTETQRRELAARGQVTQKTSPFGNMNNDGTPYPSESCLVSRFHPSFASVIEPGVRELVLAIGLDRNYVTYTSCEGHDYQGTRAENDMRHVGILPRSDREFRAAEAEFEDLATIIEAPLDTTSVELALMIHSVRTDTGEQPAIDLFLAKKEECSWQQYFADINDATDIVLKGLGELDPRPSSRAV